MVVHLFGAVSSPSIANFALKKTASDNEEEHGTLVADTMRKNFYVDDCLRSVSSEDAAVKLIEGLCQSCQKGGFHLTKFTSNRRAVLQCIPEVEWSKEVKSIALDCDNLPVERNGVYSPTLLDFESLLTANRLQDEESCLLCHQFTIHWALLLRSRC